MKARCPIITVVLLAVAGGIPACTGPQQQTESGPKGVPAKPKVAAKKPKKIHSAETEKAIGAIEKLGGKVELDEKLPGKPVYSVRLATTKVNATDADLVHLKELTELELLFLNYSKVTDTGLVHLNGLTKLKTLWLNSTKVTSAGLVHLKGLTKLERLWLRNTKVDDAGLAHLKALTSLRLLKLNNTQVTAAGVKELQKALPNCYIDH